MKTILAMILISVVLLSGCSLLDAGSIVPICVEGGYGCPTTGTSGTFSYNSARNRIIFEGQQRGPGSFGNRCEDGGVSIPNPYIPDMNRAQCESIGGRYENKSVPGTTHCVDVAHCEGNVCGGSPAGFDSYGCQLFSGTSEQVCQDVTSWQEAGSCANQCGASQITKRECYYNTGTQAQPQTIAPPWTCTWCLGLKNVRIVTYAMRPFTCGGWTEPNPGECEKYDKDYRERCSLSEAQGDWAVDMDNSRLDAGAIKNSPVASDSSFQKVHGTPSGCSDPFKEIFVFHVEWRPINEVDEQSTGVDATEESTSSEEETSDSSSSSSSSSQDTSQDTTPDYSDSTDVEEQDLTSYLIAIVVLMIIFAVMSKD